MGVPKRFATQYPARVLQLIEHLETFAADRQLLGSFGLLAAAAVLTIPFEHVNPRHLLQRPDRNADLIEKLKGLDDVEFLAAPFWAGADPGGWHQSRIVEPTDQVDRWQDEFGMASLSGESNTIERRTALDVIRVLRNALAHGNIIYLDEYKRETVDDRMEYIAFLSRYDEPKKCKTCGQRTADPALSYRVVTTSEGDFLKFVKAWAKWVSVEPVDDSGQVQL